MLVLEYKGAHLANTEDTAEKANIGARLEEISGGNIVFWMAERARDPDFPARMDEKIGNGA